MVHLLCGRVVLYSQARRYASVNERYLQPVPYGHISIYPWLERDVLYDVSDRDVSTQEWVCSVYTMVHLLTRTVLDSGLDHCRCDLRGVPCGHLPTGRQLERDFLYDMDPLRLSGIRWKSITIARHCHRRSPIGGHPCLPCLPCLPCPDHLPPQ